MARRGTGSRLLLMMLLAAGVVGWLGWRGGWWGIGGAARETGGAVGVSTPEQVRRAAMLERPVDLPDQFEPPLFDGDNSLSLPTFVDDDPLPGGLVVPAAGEEPAVPAVPARSARPLLSLPEIDVLIKQGQTAKANAALSRIYFQDVSQRGNIAKRIEQTAGQLYFSPRPHILPAYTVRAGDSLGRIAPRYRIGWQYLARLNRVDPQRIRAGQKLKVVQGPFRVDIDTGDFTLIVRHGKNYVRRFRVGIGKDNSTPLGRFRVLRKIPDPQYTDPDGQVIAAGADDNPLGKFWIDLGDSYGIHGTNEPKSIGKAKSRGCLRMRNRDVEQLYGMLVTGCEVVIHR